MSTLSINPTVTVEDYSKAPISTVDFLSPELEIIECDTILGLTKYHLFNNSNPLCTWIRNSNIGEIHVLTLMYPTGAPVTVNSINTIFTLNAQIPLIKIIYTSTGYKRIID
jgi:hypothetical protein